MKPVSTIFFALIVVVSAHAQIEKAPMFFPAASITAPAMERVPDIFGIGIFITVGCSRYGHFFGEKTEAGISIGYYWNHNDSKYTGNFSSSSESSSGLFLVGPYVRLYQNLAEHFISTFIYSNFLYRRK
jgi:hypothetical protein